MISRRFALAVLVAAMLSAMVAARQSAAPQAFATDVASYVDPLFGTATGGNVLPGAVVPFGMVAWSPEEQRPDPQRGPDAMRAAASGRTVLDAPPSWNGSGTK
jgi:putative alpha-1,2-mannosidase